MGDRSKHTRRACGGIALIAMTALVASLGAGRSALGATPSPDPERAFLADAAAIGRAMVETGRLAAQRGGSPDIRAIGHTVADDWSAWLRDLARLADDRVVTLPSTLDLERQAVLERLQSMSGEAFDAAYLDALRPLHDAAEQLFEAASHSTDTGIQGFAEHALPQLRADRRSTGKLGIASDEARTARTSARQSGRRIAMRAAAARTFADRRLRGGR